MLFAKLRLFRVIRDVTVNLKISSKWKLGFQQLVNKVAAGVQLLLRLREICECTLCLSDEMF